MKTGQVIRFTLPRKLRRRFTKNSGQTTMVCHLKKAFFPRITKRRTHTVMIRISPPADRLPVPVQVTLAAAMIRKEKFELVLQKAAELFGPESILPDGTLNRPWVADKIFNDHSLMLRFESIMQQQVWDDLLRFLEAQKADGTAAVFLDLPLMIELGWHKLCDSVWLIAVSKELRIQRAVQRDKNLPPETVIQRINNQPPLSELKKYAHVIIDNSGDFEHTKVQILENLRKVELGL